MELTEQQAHILKIWQLAAEENPYGFNKYSGFTQDENGNMIVFIIKKDFKFNFDLKTTRYVYDSNGKMIASYVPDVLK